MKNHKIMDNFDEKILNFSTKYSSAPYLFTRIFHTYIKIFNTFFPNSCNSKINELYAFSPLDLRFRGWYNKISNDFYRRGRLGYIWDNGLGMPATDLTYNNFITYTLLRLLGTRYYMLSGFILILATTTYLLHINIGIIAAISLILFIAPSPLFIACFTRLGKPECAICGISLTALYMLIDGNFVEAGILWSAISMINLPECLMLIIYAGIFGTAQSLANGNFSTLLLGMTPGILKTSLRLIPMWISGFMKKITDEQTKIWSKNTWIPRKDESFFLILYTTSLLITAITNRNIYACIALVTGPIAFLANTRILYYNDFQSTAMYLWMTGFCFASVSGNIPALIPLVIMLYPPIDYLHYYPLPSKQKQARISENEIKILALLQYPGLMPMPYLYPAQLRKFYDSFPCNTRFLTEFDGDPRTKSGLRRFWSWGDHARELRTLNLANSMYMKIQEQELNDNVITQLHIPGISGKKFDSVLKKLGASHIVVYSETSLMGLVAQKYKIRFICDLEQEPLFCSLLNIKPRKLFLLEAPEKRSTVGGTTDLSIEGSTLTWTAKKSNTYLIRYRYAPGFSATLNGKNLEITTYKPFAEASTIFMSVRANEDGILRVHFKSPLLPKLSDICQKFSSVKTTASCKIAKSIQE